MNELHEAARRDGSIYLAFEKVYSSLFISNCNRVQVIANILKAEDTNSLFIKSPVIEECFKNLQWYFHKVTLHPLFPGSNWNLEVLVFVEGGKPENLEKNPRSKDENQQQTQPTYDAEPGNRTQTT